MRVLTAAFLVIAILSGCVADQSREASHAEWTSMADAEVRRHGQTGTEVAEMFHSGRVGEARRPEDVEQRGVQVEELYSIEIARDPMQPSVLTPVGYARKLDYPAEGVSLFEFVDYSWNRVGYMTETGELYRVEGGEEVHVGRRQPEAAARELFPAPSGYGYDRELQDRTIASMHDPDVSSLDSRRRGADHRGHRSAPPVVAFTELPPADARRLAERFEKDRYDELVRERKRRIREEQGVVAPELDDDYSGMTDYRWRDGNPVDDQGRPVDPHDDGR